MYRTYSSQPRSRVASYFDSSSVRLGPHAGGDDDFEVDDSDAKSWAGQEEEMDEVIKGTVDELIDTAVKESGVVMTEHEKSETEHQLAEVVMQAASQSQSNEEIKSKVRRAVKNLISKKSMQVDDSSIQELQNAAVRVAAHSTHGPHTSSSAYAANMRALVDDLKSKKSTLRGMLQKSNQFLKNYQINSSMKNPFNQINSFETSIRESMDRQDKEFMDEHKAEYKAMSNYYDKPYSQREGRPPYPDLKKERFQNKYNLAEHLPKLNDLWQNVHTLYRDIGTVKKKIGFPVQPMERHGSMYWVRPALKILSMLKFVYVEIVYKHIRDQTTKTPDMIEFMKLRTVIKNAKKNVNKARAAIRELRKQHRGGRPRRPRERWTFKDDAEMQMIRKSTREHTGHDQPTSEYEHRSNEPSHPAGSNGRGRGGGRAGGRGRGRGAGPSSG